MALPLVQVRLRVLRCVWLISNTIRTLNSRLKMRHLIACPLGRAGLRSYYRAKIEELELLCRDKQLNLRRLEAQRNEYNTKGR